MESFPSGASGANPLGSEEGMDVCHGLAALIARRVGSGFWRALQSRPHRIL